MVYLINLIVYLWNKIESDMIEIWFYIKMQLKLNHTSWDRELNFRVLPVKRLNTTHTADWRKSAFFPLPFFFVILHNWRAWIIYNSQIIFWMVSASGRQRGNFNDVPGSAKPSFTVSQPEKLPAEYHPPSHWLRRVCLQEGTESAQL